MEHKKTLTEKFEDWCANPSPAARLQRTIAQGIIGVALGYLASLSGTPEFVNMIIVPLTMAVLAPIQAEIGKGDLDD